MKVRPTQSRKGVKGGDFVPFRLPLAGARDSVPCGVWGNAPTVPRPTNPKEAVNKGAGSAASLPLTLRVRRRAPKLLFPQDSVKNHKKSMLLNSLKHGFSLFSAQLFQHFIQRAIVLLVLRQRRLRRNHVGFEGGFACFFLLHALRRQLMHPVLRQLHRLLLA